MKRNSGRRTVTERSICALLLAFVFALGSPVWAQTTQGNIFGNVTDPSGAALPGATVTVTSVEQGTVRTTKASTSGEYRIAELPPGAYVVSASSPGFGKARTSRIDLAIEASVRTDLVLKPGTDTTVVNVSSNQPLLETGSAEISSQVTAEELRELPSVDRNIVGLMSLAPGVSGGNYDPSSPNAGGRVGQITGAEVVAMGTPPVGNSFLIDGVATNMEFSGTIAARPPMDFASGFQVQVAQFPADEGRAAGAILNRGLKSGTNKFHGSVYGYVQNNATNAKPKNYTNVVAKTPYHRYQYGANIGGPIKHDKLFFFTGFEGLRQLQTSQATYTVPAMSEKTLYNDYAANGITAVAPPVGGCDGYYFGPTTDANGASFGGITVYDPTSRPYGSTAARTAFPGNCIPASYVSPVAKSLLALYPNPNTSANARSYIQDVPRSVIADWEIGKVNYTLTPKDAVDLHFFRQNSFVDSTGINPDVTETTLSQNGVNSGVNYTRTITPSLLNVARISYTRFVLYQASLNQTNFLSASIPGWPGGSAGQGVPGITPASITSIAALQLVSAFSSPFRLKENNYSAQDMVMWQKGAHSFKIGGEYEQIRFWQNRGRSGGGNLNFGGVSTSSSPSTTLPDGVSDMLLGLATGVTAQFAFTPNGIALRTHYIMPFVQDDWRATRRLTINMGLRYDIFTPYHVEHDFTENFDPITGTVLIPSQSTFARDSYGFTNGLPAHWAYADRSQVYKQIYWKSFDPRLGLSWQAASRVVVRAGFGLYHLPVMGNEYLNGTTNTNDVVPSISSGAPFCLDNTQKGWCPSVGFPSNPAGGFQAVLTSQGFVPYFMPRNLPDPYSQKYTTDIEFAFARNASVDVGYMGAGTHHFATLYNANQAPVSSTSVSLAARQPYPYFGNPLYSYAQVDHTNYNGGYVSLQFRNWHGLQFKSYYTYSKTLGLTTGNDVVLVTPSNADYDYGPLDYDIRHRSVTSFVYRIPKPNLKFVGAVIGHWDVSGIVNLQSGLPMTVTTTGGTALGIGTVGGSGQRPYLLHNPNLPKDKRTQQQWFDTTAFANTYWCTGAQSNQDIVTSAGYAINDAGNPCKGLFAIPAPSAQTNKPLMTHIVSNTAATIPIPFGNEGKNAIQGPGQQTFNTAIQRRFALREGYITFRLEEHNLFNHPNYHNPGGLNLNAVNFGVINSSQTYPRQLQGSLRYDF